MTPPITPPGTAPDMPLTGPPTIPISAPKIAPPVAPAAAATPTSYETFRGIVTECVFASGAYDIRHGMEYPGFARPLQSNAPAGTRDSIDGFLTLANIATDDLS